MITDKFSLKYSPEDLRNEWRSKIQAFREILLDFPEYSDALKALITLSEHIYHSAYSSLLFPGTDPDKLIMMLVRNGKIQTDVSLDIRISGEEKASFLISLRREWNRKIEREMTCTEEHLQAAFESLIKQLQSSYHDPS